MTAIGVGGAEAETNESDLRPARKWNTSWRESAERSPQIRPIVLVAIQ
jgi:hypothetical protein